MKKILILLLLIVARPETNATAGSPPLEKLGQHWSAGDASIRWEGSPSELPSSATVYRVVSATFSPTVLSNLLVLAGLSEKDRGKPTWDGAGDQDMWFQDAEGSRSLGVGPDRGHVVVRNRKAIPLPGQPVEGVPDWPEALRLAEAILRTIGIDRTKLVHQEGSDELRYTKAFRSINSFDRQQGKRITTVVAREVFLIRSFDGIPSIGLGGGGGIRFIFGNHAQLAELDMIWRKVEPKGRYPVATKEQFLERVKKGDCVCEFDSPAQIQALTLKEVEPYYLELREWEPQEEIHPIAEFFGYAQLPWTNMPVLLYCPLVVYP